MQTKFVVLLCDGMADLPVKELGYKTPMQAAHKPNMDKLAQNAVLGMCKTVADGLKPGSDVANLAVLGYDPKTCYSGRSPLEAANLGITLTDSQIAMRCNLVTLSDAPSYAERTMVDYCGGDISTQEADQLIHALEQAFGNETRHFYTGVQYRHCLVVENGHLGLNLTPPHDISGRVIGEYLSDCPDAAPFIQLMEQSVAVLEKHPVNQARKAAGKRPANSAWFWGEGKRPNLALFSEKYGLKGSVVSAVDLIRGIGRLAGMRVAQVDGATGYIDTNFAGKAQAALQELQQGQDFVYIHVEAPDECGHRGEIQNKVRAIELIDQQILGPVLEGLRQYDHYKILIMPDHPTPLSIRTHTADPVPFMIYDSKQFRDGAAFSEENASATGNYIENSLELMPLFLNK